MESLYRLSSGAAYHQVPEKDRQAVQQLKKAAQKHLPPSFGQHSSGKNIESMDVETSEGVPEVDLSNVLMHKTAALSADETVPNPEEVLGIDTLIEGFEGDWSYSHDQNVRLGRKVFKDGLHSQQGKQRGVLVLESSGGGGHIAVAKQVVSELEAEGGTTSGENQSIYRKNVMDDFLGTHMTNAMVGPWNKAVREGNIEKQRSMLKKRHLGEMVVYLPIFLGTLFTLAGMKTPPKKVITTQPLGLKAILKAVATYNKIMTKINKSWVPIVVEQKLTDLLTPKAIHFVSPLKSLSAAEREQLIVQIPGEEADFKDTFKDLIGEGFHEVKYTGNSGLPVNPLFLSDELEAYTPGNDVQIPLNSLTKQQEDRIRQVPNLSRRLGKTSKDDKGLGTIDYHVEGPDQLHQLMLGSMPSEPNVMSFVAASLYLAKCAEQRGTPPPCHHVRLMCGRDVDNNPSLFKVTCDALSKYEEWSQSKIPEWLHICPLPFQAPANIAKGGMRANKYFTRGGGATAMEHIAMSGVKERSSHQDQHDAGNVYIVGEGTQQFDTPKEMIENDFPLLWEGGNASFLSEHIGAEVTNRHNLLNNLAPSYLGDGKDNQLTAEELKGFDAYLKGFEEFWQRTKT